MKDKPAFKLLFVCGRNLRRSPTAEKIYQNDHRLKVRSAGVSESSRRNVAENDLLWADLVLVIESKHAERIRSRFSKGIIPPIRCLGISDDYDHMEPELIDLLEASVEHELELILN